MLDLRRSELMLLLREGMGGPASPASGPFCERQPKRDSSPVDHYWNMRFAPLDPRVEPIHLNTHLTWRFRGTLDVDRLEHAAREVQRRHSILGSVLHYTGDERRFLTGAAPELQTARLDAPDASDAEALGVLHDFAWRRFSWDTDGPVRMATVMLTHTDYLISVTTHHGFTDSYSTRIFSHELATLYRSFVENREPKLPEPPIQFCDYLISIEAWSAQPAAARFLSHWRRYLHGARGLQIERDEQLTFHTFKVSSAVSDAIRRLCEAEKTGVNAFWEAAHQLSLWRLLQQTDITTLVLDVGRRQKELVRSIGRYMNLLPARVQVDPSLTVREFLDRSTASRRESLPYLSTPYWLIQDQCDFPFPESLGILNFVPSEFLPFECFGKFLKLELPPLEPGLRFPLAYCISVSGAAEFSVGVVGNLRLPFNVIDLCIALERTVALMIEEPTRRLSSLS